MILSKVKSLLWIKSLNSVFGQLKGIYSILFLIHLTHKNTTKNINNDSLYATMLYDHSKDPDENVNISDRHENAELIKSLGEVLKKERGGEVFGMIYVTFLNCRIIR